MVRQAHQPGGLWRSIILWNKLKYPLSPYQRHTTMRYNIERRIKNMLAKRLRVDKKAPDKAIANVFDNKNLNQRLLTKQQLAIESVANSKTYDFSSAMPNSFLPQIIQLAKSNNIEIAFVRLRRRRDANGEETSKSLNKYIANLENYLDEQKDPFIDFTDLKEIKEHHYADGDHLTQHGAALFTDSLAQRMIIAMPELFPKDKIVTNLIANGDFSDELSGWYVWKSPATIKMKTEFHDIDNNMESGSKYLTLQKEKQGTGSIQTFIPVYSGCVYKVSAMMRKTNKIYTSKGTLGFYMAHTAAPCTQIRKLSNEWTRKELTYNCKNDGVVTIYVNLDENTGSSSLDVTDIQCVKINK